MKEGKPEQVLLIEPKKDLYFKGPYNETVSSYIKLTNPLSTRVCFKVKTTAPKRYCVRPNNGVIEPNSTQVVTVMLQPFDRFDQLTDKSRHKFMIQSLIEPEGCDDHEKIWKIYSNQTMDSKLKCVFDEPIHPEPERKVPEAISPHAALPAVEPAKGETEPIDTDRIVGQTKEESELQKILEELKRIKDENLSLRTQMVGDWKGGVTQRITSTKPHSQKQVTEKIKTEGSTWYRFLSRELFTWLFVLNFTLFIFGIGVFLGRVGYLNSVGSYIKATSHAVGIKVVGPPVRIYDDHLWVFSNPKNKQVSGLTTKSVESRVMATSASVNAFNQIRFLHNDLKIPNFDDWRRSSTLDATVPSKQTAPMRKGFTCLIATGIGVTGAVLIKSVARGIVGFLGPGYDVLSLSKIEIDLSKISQGTNSVFKWRGSPLFVKHRTPEEIKRERETDIAILRDPEADEQRVQDPRYLVTVGICTHLGCIPIANQGDFPGGYYCPCHGSHYDASGRIRKGPAPLNLKVPQYVIQGDTLIVG